jgi:hypothetical protein
MQICKHVCSREGSWNKFRSNLQCVPTTLCDSLIKKRDNNWMRLKRVLNLSPRDRALHLASTNRVLLTRDAI